MSCKQGMCLMLSHGLRLSHVRKPCVSCRQGMCLMLSPGLRLSHVQKPRVSCRQGMCLMLSHGLRLSHVRTALQQGTHALAEAIRRHMDSMAYRKACRSCAQDTAA